MEIFIEKDILDKLNKDFQNENLSLGQKKLREVLHSYAELEFCINIKFDKLEFENYKLENSLFNKIVENADLKSFNSLSEFLNLSSFKQTIVIDKKEDSIKRELVENKGGLYFTYDLYSNNIEEIITHFQIKIDLSENFAGWSKIFNKSFLKLNEIIVNDNYLIDNSENIEKFIKPLIHSVKKQCKLERIIFFTEWKNKPNYQLEEKTIQIKAIYNIAVKIYHNNFKNFSNHDRVLYSNFLLIDCPIGFNKIKLSNSIITIETIFDKFTYNRRRRHFIEIEKFLQSESFH